MSRPILIAGMSDAGPASLPQVLLDRIRRASLLIGGARHLRWFPDVAAERMTITNNVEAVCARLRAALEEPGEAVVLASGDPLWYGIGATLRRSFAAEELEIHPAPSAPQLAFAALGEPWAGAALLSAHARPLTEVLRGCATATRAAILTDSTHTPATIACALLAAGHSPSRPTAIAENLGGPRQRIWRGTLSEAAQQEAGALNVFVLLPDGAATTVDRFASATAVAAPPLPEDAFAHRASLITKQEIRTLALAALRPHGAALWDIGAGCGAVGIEAALMGARSVWAIEKNEADCELIRENVARFGVGDRFHLTHGRAPEGCARWPAPDAVFVGGSGGELEALLRDVWERLQPGGRLVAAFVTIENLAAANVTLKALQVTAEITQVSIARGRPILDMTRFEALNPVWLVRAAKERLDHG